MGIPPTQTGLVDINTMDTQSQGPSHGSKVIGPKFHAHAHQPFMGTPSTDWPHWQQYHGRRKVHKNPKVKVMLSMSEITGTKCHAHAHLPLMGSPQGWDFALAHGELKMAWASWNPCMLAQVAPGMCTKSLVNLGALGAKI